MPWVTLRVYGSLNDFLPPRRRHQRFAESFDGSPSVKDLIERLGVPHPEIDLILINGDAVGFEHRVQDGDAVAVYPRFRAIDVAATTLVRPAPPPPRFLVDGHLGKLARYLRLLGLDTVYDPHAADDELAAAAAGRILLTRDIGLLKRRAVTWGRFVRNTAAMDQLTEVLDRFGPFPLAPLTRCLRCNGTLDPVAKAAIEAELPPRTRASFDEFLRCRQCGRPYWKGAHWPRIARIIEVALGR